MNWSHMYPLRAIFQYICDIKFTWFYIHNIDYLNVLAWDNTYFGYFDPDCHGD